MYIPCIQLYRQHPVIFHQEFKKKNSTDECANKETLGGYPIDEFKKEDLYTVKKSKKTYCLRKDQMNFLKKDPYTMKRIPYIGHHQISVPISVLLDYQLCPVRPLTTVSDNRQVEHLILISPAPITNKSELPVKISFGNKYNENLTLQIVESVNPINIYTGYYYVVRLQKPISQTVLNKKKFIYKKDMKDLASMYQKEMIIAYRHDQKFDANIKIQLSAFFNYQSRVFSFDTLDFFRRIRIVPQNSVKCFRGLLIHSKKKLQDLHLSDIKTGDTIRLDSRKYPMSWSTDSCVSSYFATHEAAMISSDADTIMFGILISTRIKPDDILLDSRLISPQYFVKQLYRRYQDEVITFPVDDHNNPIVFECKIERLFLIDAITSYFTIVRRFDKFLV